MKNTIKDNKSVGKKETICECPEKGFVPPARYYQYSEEEQAGMNHEPNKCKGTFNIKKYKRGDKELYLCSCCWLFGDEEIS